MQTYQKNENKKYEKLFFSITNFNDLNKKYINWFFYKYQRKKIKN